MARSLGIRFLATCLSLGMLAGCGAEPATSPGVPAASLETVITPVAAAPKPKATAKPTKKTAPAKPPAKTTPPSTKPSSRAAAKPATKPSAAPAPQAADATETLAELKTALAGLSTTQSWNLVTDNKKDGSKTTTTKSLTRFQSPGAYRIEVLSSTNTSKVGNRAVFTYGENQAKVKAGGVLGLVTLTLGMTDEKLLSHNGWTLNQFVLRGVLDRLTGSGYAAQVAGTTKVAGTDLKVLKVTSAQNALDADIDYELIGYDSDMNVRLWSVYGKSSLGLAQNLMYQLVIEKVETNVTLPSDTFKL